LKKTGVLIHGYNVNSPNWLTVVWGNPPDLLGRLPRGVMVAIEEKADIVVFGTGASELNGKIEAAVMRDYLLEHFYNLKQFSVFKKIDLKKIRERIKDISRLEIKSKNTREEVKFALQIFKEEGIEKVVLVTSPDHVSRSLRDAYIVAEEDETLRNFTKDLFATPSQTTYTDHSVRDVQILEPR